MKIVWCRCRGRANSKRKTSTAARKKPDEARDKTYEKCADRARKQVKAAVSAGDPDAACIMAIEVLRYAPNDEDARKLKYAYLSRAQDVSLDAQGRIQLSPDYRERAALDKDVLVIGMLEHFEVWNPERWQHLGEQREPLSDLFDRVARKGV